uniref:Uncharacterized protein n=1 Tax=Rousettus aegyptiacus TaxID=9407 RepID=A0A7J8JHG4_ROUAE|nr:hypothetical protein HJG63_010149 [Rousettus aegyptiacus]
MFMGYCLKFYQCFPMTHQSEVKNRIQEQKTASSVLISFSYYKENNHFIYSSLFYFLFFHCPPIPPPFSSRGPSDDHGCGLRLSSIREYRKYMNTLLKTTPPHCLSSHQYCSYSLWTKLLDLNFLLLG